METTTNNNKLSPPANKAAANKDLCYSFIALILSLIPLSGIPIFTFISALIAVGLLSSAISFRGSFLPLLSLLPFSVICIVSRSYINIAIPATIAVLAAVFYLSLKLSGKKTVTVISGTVIILLLFIIIICCEIVSAYGAVDNNSFESMREDGVALVENYLESYADILNEASPGIIDKDVLLAASSAYVTFFIYIVPGLLIFTSVLISYFASLLFYFITKKGTFSCQPTKENSKITISMAGAAVFTVSIIVISFSLWFGFSVLSIIALNFLLIYAPFFAVIGVNYYINGFKKGRAKNVVMLILLFAVMMYFSPIIPVMILLFGGVKSTVNDYLLAKIAAAKGNGGNREN